MNWRHRTFIAHHRFERAFTLIELMVVVAIVGVLATLAGYGVSKYLRHAKTAEVQNVVGQLAKDAKASYERESMETAILNGGASSRIVNNLCTDAAHPVPDSISKVSGRKYQSVTSDWSTGNSITVGFVCLRFSLNDPQYFMYDYKGSSGDSGTFAALGYGDLNGDGNTSTFSLSGVAKGGVVYVAPAIREQSPEE